MRLKNIYHFFSAFAACFYYRFPSRNLATIGVTGTDGKTTTVYLIWYILQKAGFKVAMISSVGARLGKEKLDTGFHVTTPNPWFLQRLIRKFVDQNFTHLVLETTSHGLDQHRLLGINFQIGVLTNITHEHLDYHRTYKEYLQAKARLFKKVKVAILNCEDSSYRKIYPFIPKKAKIVTYGLKKGDINLKTFSFKTKLPGKYNLRNCLAAVAAVKALGVKDTIIKKAIFEFEGVSGRMEEIKKGQNFRVIVDFAHTPNALKNALITLREKTSGRVISVFGCAGLRDFKKRPLMGEISCRLADITILTAEDPRTENLSKILNQIVAGCQKAGGIEGKTFFKIPDRRKAIEFAISKAKKGDTVGIFGKGHERSMCFGTKEYPWSDQREARKALRNLKRNA